MIIKKGGCPTIWLCQSLGNHLQCKIPQHHETSYLRSIRKGWRSLFGLCVILGFLSILIDECLKRTLQERTGRLLTRQLYSALVVLKHGHMIHIEIRCGLILLSTKHHLILTSLRFAQTEGRSNPGQLRPQRMHPYLAPEAILDLLKVTCPANVSLFGCVL
jgi:hypothetical protein